MPLNLELKARDRDPQDTLRLVRELGAVDHGVLKQRDTYFAVKTGRLKLREQSGEPAQLIGYARSGPADALQSLYHIAAVESAETVLAALSATCGIVKVVDKVRRLLIWQTVRIHLDTVQSQGQFVELEAVGANASELGHVRAGLRINQADLVEGSYGPAAA